MKVELVPARRSDERTLANLLTLYLYDFSEIVPIQMGDDASFEYDLSEYWEDPGRHALLICADGAPAGFVLVAKGSKVGGEPEVLDVDQFFVLRALRRSGVGLRAALQTFERFAGTWEVRVLELNRGALPFWERAVSAFTRRFERFEFRAGERSQVVYRFRSPPE